MRDINATVRGGTGTGNNLDGMMMDSIKQIKVPALFPVFPVSHSRLFQTTHPALNDRNRSIGSRHGLSGILDTMIDTTSTILNNFNQASNAIPAPFIHPLVASVASLLTAVQVSFQIHVFVTLRTKDCQQTRSNHGDMRQIAAVAGKFVVMLAEICAGDEMEPSRPFQQALGRFEK